MKTPPPGLIIVGALLVGAGAWGYNSFVKKEAPVSAPITQTNTSTAPSSLPTAPPPPPQVPTQQADVSQVSGTTISGATTLNDLGVALSQYGIEYQATGSSAGIKDLLEPNNGIDIAGVSRDLKPEEVQQGLVAHAIGNDAISFVVPVSSPAPVSVNYTDLPGIFNGTITDWSQVGGNPGPIDLVIRGEGGTYSTVLEGLGISSFGQGTYLSNDSSTEMLRSLNTNSIGFAAAPHVCNQNDFRSLEVIGEDGVPRGLTDIQYWPQRQVYLVTRGNPNAQQQEVITLAKQIYANQFTAQATCPN